MREALHSALISGFQELAVNRPHLWRRVIRRHNESLLGAALSDPELFSLLREELQVPTSEGHLKLSEVARRSEGRVSVSVGDDSGYEVLLHRAMGRPVVDGSRFGAAAFAQRWGEIRGNPVLILGTESADRSVFPKIGVDPAHKERLTTLFGGPDLEVVPSRFEPPSVPLVLVPNREVLLKRRLADDKIDKRLGAGLLALTQTYTDRIEEGAAARLMLNLNNPILRRLLELDEERAVAVAALLSSIADLTARSSVEGMERDLGASLRRLNGALEVLI